MKLLLSQIQKVCSKIVLANFGYFVCFIITLLISGLLHNKTLLQKLIIIIENDNWKMGGKDHIQQAIILFSMAPLLLCIFCLPERVRINFRYWLLKNYLFHFKHFGIFNER